MAKTEQNNVFFNKKWN